MRVNGNPPDLQRQRLAAFSDPCGQKRQSVSFAHSLGTMHVPDSDCFGLRPRIIGCIGNPHLPFTGRPVGRLTLPGIKPFQTCMAKILQPVMIADPVSQSFARPCQRHREVAEIVIPGRTQCGLYGGKRARANGQRVDEIKQNVAFDPETFGHRLAKLVYSFKRDSFGIHNHSMRWKPSRGEGNLPYFCLKSCYLAL